MSGVYLVNWLGGTSGAFITALLSQFIDATLNEADIIFSQHGDSHSLADRAYTKNIRIIPGPDDRSGIHTYKYIRPQNETKPLVMIDHSEPDYSELFDIFPNCKNIVVSVSDDMELRRHGNMFFKNTCQGYPGNKIYWDNQRTSHMCVSGYENPNDVPNDVAETYIREVSKVPYKVTDFFGNNYAVPEKYKNNITRIKFYDVIHRPDLVLEQLSKVTNMPVLPEHVNFYQKYLNKQTELVNTKMSWLSDK